MEYKEQLQRKRYSRAEMMKRVARFSKLKGFDGGLPDSKFPGAERKLFNVIGFQPPKDESAGMQSPVGAQASRMAAIKITEGFNLGYCKALAGQGPDAAQPRYERDLHRHDRRLARQLGKQAGQARACRPEAAGRDFVPPGASRRFMNVTKGPKNRESILMFVIGGDTPRAEFTSESMAQVIAAGVWPPGAKKPAAKKAAPAKPAAKKAAKKAVTRKPAAASGKTKGPSKMIKARTGVSAR